MPHQIPCWVFLLGGHLLSPVSSPQLENSDIHGIIVGAAGQDALVWVFSELFPKVSRQPNSGRPSRQDEL